MSELESTADLKTLVVDYLQGLSPNAAIVDGIVRSAMFLLCMKWWDRRCSLDFIWDIAFLWDDPDQDQ